jgi:hypothetical protein
MKTELLFEKLKKNGRMELPNYSALKNNDNRCR